MNIYSTKKMIAYIVMLVIGLLFIVAGAMEFVDSYISGFGGGIVGVAAVRLFLGMKYRKDADYAKHVDIANSDERVLFISNKAKSWSFYLTVVISALAGLILNIAGYRDYGSVCFYFVCLLVLIYWVAYMICDRKY